MTPQNGGGDGSHGQGWAFPHRTCTAPVLRVTAREPTPEPSTTESTAFTGPKAELFCCWDWVWDLLWSLPSHVGHQPRNCRAVTDEWSAGGGGDSRTVRPNRAQGLTAGPPRLALRCCGPARDVGFSTRGAGGGGSCTWQGGEACGRRPERGGEWAAGTVKRPPQQPAQPPVCHLLGLR